MLVAGVSDVCAQLAVSAIVAAFVEEMQVLWAQQTDVSASCKVFRRLLGYVLHSLSLPEAVGKPLTRASVVGQSDMVALFFLYYNFCRVHSTLRVTPAMEAGISNHVWTIEELCGLLPEIASATKRIDRDLVLKALNSA